MNSSIHKGFAYDMQSGKIYNFNGDPLVFNKEMNLSIDAQRVPKKMNLYYDTEFTDRKNLSIQIHISTAMSKNITLIYPISNLNSNFHPVITPLQDYGYDIEFFPFTQINQLFENLDDRLEKLVNGRFSIHTPKKFLQYLNDGSFDDILSTFPFNLNTDLLSSRLDKYSGKFRVSAKIPKIIIDLEAFFSIADIFRIFGSTHHDVLMNNSVESRRFPKATLGVQSKYFNKNSYLYKGRVFENTTFVIVAGRIYRLLINLRDAMYRLPPKNKGLAYQAEIFKAEIPKMDIKTPEIADKMGVSLKDIMANMDKLLEVDPELFIKYSALDVFATREVSLKQQQFYDSVLDTLGLSSTNIKDTVGSNVSEIIKLSIYKYFRERVGDDTSWDVNQDKKTVSMCISRATIKYFNKMLSEQDGIDFGTQTLKTVGGLLYTRMSKFPYLKGIFGDLDESSCYATMLSSINLYLGTPIITTFKNEEDKPLLKEVIPFLKKNSPRDGWMLRVSNPTIQLANGNRNTKYKPFEQVINTLLLSDLKFDKDRKTSLKELGDISNNRRTIGFINSKKISETQAESKLLSKEIQFAVITADIWDCIELFPEEWFRELENLLVDAIVFHHNDLICETVVEFEEKKQSLALSNHLKSEKFLPNTGLKNMSLNYTSHNLSLKFPIKNFYKLVKDKREKAKKAGDNIQEVYKIILNTGYGALANIHMSINNMLSANIITAGARATSWLMINALNGFQVITDGCTFSWEHIPTNITFNKLLKQNPEYLLSFDENVHSNLEGEYYNQEWINSSFKEHMMRFYEAPDSHIPINRFNFELKTESFTDVEGTKISISIFTEFYNHGAGSYLKGFDGHLSHKQIEECYEFDDNLLPVKARAYDGRDQGLINWYSRTLKNGYKNPYISTQNEIIKLSAGNDIVLQHLKNSDEPITHPMGYSRTIYRCMKLITQSQFIFQTIDQFKKFDRFMSNRMSNLSKNIFTLSDFPDRALYDFSCQYPVGLGLEILALNGNYDGDIGRLREYLFRLINEGKDNFSASFHLERILKTHSHKFKDFLIELVKLKKKEKERLINVLLYNNQPTSLKVSKNKVFTKLELGI